MPVILEAVVVGLLTCQLSLFLTTVFLHRASSHRALILRPGLRFACRLLVWIFTGITVREWVAVHRKHHAYTDIQGDPHSPLLEGFAQVQLGNVLLYRREARNPETVARYARDLPADGWDRVLFDHGWVGLGLGVGILFGIFQGAWLPVLVAAAVHVVVYLLVNSAVNAVGHAFGRRPFTGLATNNQWLAWLAAGEGLHSNHHAAPTSARLSLRRGELDPGWWVIAALRRFGWLTVRHAEPKVRAKATRTPELV
ncbi:MAG: fatty acid desaturase [Acidimicrobiaceae bacterium]|nr:fatty acid desaturase [Acidimicrobiaceae bacterium]